MQDKWVLYILQAIFFIRDAFLCCYSFFLYNHMKFDNQKLLSCPVRDRSLQGPPVLLITCAEQLCYRNDMILLHVFGQGTIYIPYVIILNFFKYISVYIHIV